MSLEQAAKSSRLEALYEMRSILARSIEDAQSNGDTAHISAMVKQMDALMDSIEKIERQTRKKSRKSSIERARASANG